MTWNYRVIKRNDILTIRECFYHNKRSKKPHSVTVDPCWPEGETLQDLREDLEFMMKALDQPILDYERDFRFDLEKYIRFKR